MTTRCMPAIPFLIISFSSTGCSFAGPPGFVCQPKTNFVFGFCARRTSYSLAGNGMESDSSFDSKTGIPPGWTKNPTPRAAPFSEIGAIPFFKNGITTIFPVSSFKTTPPDSGKIASCAGIKLGGLRNFASESRRVGDTSTSIFERSMFPPLAWVSLSVSNRR